MSLTTEQEKDINNFLQTIEESFSGLNPKTFWPLNGGQIGAYFDADEALDIYFRINKLKETHSIEQIADLMPNADTLRLFLQNNGIVGLKVAKKLNLVNITNEDMTNYTLFMLDIIKQKVNSDVYNLDGKNLLINEEKIKEIAQTTYWDFPQDDNEKKQIAILTIAANNLSYTLFYDIFMTGGFYLHGPYNVKQFFGKNTIMIIRDYHNLNPKELWPELEMSFKTIKIYAIYKNLNIKLNFVNHPITNDTIGDKLVAYKVYIDNKPSSLSKIEETISILNNIATSQAKKINSLADLDKVRKGAEIAFYQFKKLREYMGDNWRPPIIIENTIQKFGDEFIKKFKYKEKPSMEHWKKLFDPRIDYY
ncbi:MAG: hypothetical protein WC796_04360 [Candidatus Pacearchaeota archaeon]|jgi:hypothetical protein